MLRAGSSSPASQRNWLRPVPSPQRPGSARRSPGRHGGGGPPPASGGSARRPAGPHQPGVGGDLFQTRAGDRPERFARAHRCAELGASKWRAPEEVRERSVKPRSALVTKENSRSKRSWSSLARVKQAGAIPRLQLQFELGHRRSPVPGRDLAAIEARLDDGAPRGNPHTAALDAHREQRRHTPFHERPGGGGGASQIQIGRVGPDRCFHSSRPVRPSAPPRDFTVCTQQPSSRRTRRV